MNHCHEGGYAYDAQHVHASRRYAFHRFPLHQRPWSRVRRTRPVIVLRGRGSTPACARKIKEEREERGHHGKEPRERELGPRERRQARVLKRFGRVREHVDESGGQNHPSGEGLRRDKEVAVGAEEAAVFSDERYGDSGHAS
ncbi:hypothetical protein CR513_62414, partial [Mucuna pruriens]